MSRAGEGRVHARTRTLAHTRQVESERERERRALVSDMFNSTKYGDKNHRLFSKVG